MYIGERPIGAAKDKQTDTMASCNPLPTLIPLFSVFNLLAQWQPRKPMRRGHQRHQHFSWGAQPPPTPPPKCHPPLMGDTW